MPPYSEAFQARRASCQDMRTHTLSSILPSLGRTARTLKKRTFTCTSQPAAE